MRTVREAGTREKLYALVVAWRRGAGLREALDYTWDAARDEVEGSRVRLSAEESERELRARGWDQRDLDVALGAMNRQGEHDE